MDKLKKKLLARQESGSLRSIKRGQPHLIDFSSNDYLGLARSEELKQLIFENYREKGHFNGSTGSRLITGNSELTEETEQKLAKIFNSECALVFNSGYMANLALFSSLPQKGDTVIYDELSHACIKEGCRLNLATNWSFKHNNLLDLKNKIERAEGNIYVACESIYSMDGDLAPLPELADLCESTGAHLIVDEAHSTGVYGLGGSGLVNDLRLRNKVLAVIYTFGKGMGIHGACISCNRTIKEYIINFSRPFIYTTAPSDFELISTNSAFDYLSHRPSLSLNLENKQTIFNELLPEYATPSAIKAVVIGGNQKTQEIALKVQNEGFDVRPILSPTVKEGTERLRICLHSYNSEQEINLLCQLLKQQF